MDFHSLSRKELQALCKNNKIPANMTNVAMADALQALEFVDGIGEALKPCESDVANSSMESPRKSEAVTSVLRTSRRTTQRKTTKHDSETLQTSTRSHCRTRGTVVKDGDEAKNDLHETPALPTTRRRGATASVRTKLDSVMKECEPKEKIEDQTEEEKKDISKTPAAARASQRKEVKAKSSVRQVYSTRRSVRLAGKPMQEPSTQEDEKSGTLTFDVVAEETDGNLEVSGIHAVSEENDESLEVNSELHSVDKTEELDENGVVQSFESMDIKDESDTVSGQDSNTLVQIDEKEDVVHRESGNDPVVVALDTEAIEDSEEGSLGQNNNGSEEVSGSEQDEPHCGDTSDFVAENDGEEKDTSNQIFECQLDEGAECNSDVAGKQELIGKPVSVNPDTNIDLHEVNLVGQFDDEVEAKVPASQQKCSSDVAGKLELIGESVSVNPDTNIDLHEVNLFEQFNGEVEAIILTDMEDAGEEEPMEENEVYHSAANVDSSIAQTLEVAGEERMEEYDVDCTEANVDAPADSLEVDGEEAAMKEYDIDCTEADVDAPADSLEVAGEEEPVEEYDVECAEANVDAEALEVAGEEESKEESEVDYAEATVESAAHYLPPLPLIPNAAQEGECEVKVGGSQQCLHVSDVAREEPVEESEIDHVEANVDAPARALPTPASLMPNTTLETVFTLTLDPMLNPSTLASTNPELITETPLQNSSAATSKGQILVSDNKENLVCSKENKGTVGINSKQTLQDLSLRKLTKMLKDLTISKGPSGKEVANSRSALQKLPENRLTSANKN